MKVLKSEGNFSIVAHPKIPEMFFLIEECGDSRCTIGFCSKHPAGFSWVARAGVKRVSFFKKSHALNWLWGRSRHLAKPDYSQLEFLNYFPTI